MWLIFFKATPERRSPKFNANTKVATIFNLYPYSTTTRVVPHAAGALAPAILDYINLTIKGKLSATIMFQQNFLIVSFL